MKKCLLLITFALFSQHSRSQILISLLFGDKLNSDKIEFGLDGGINWSTIRFLDMQRRLGTFNLGFYFDFKFPKRQWMIATGVIVKSNMGANDTQLYPTGDAHLDSSFVGGKVTKRISYFNVPVQLKYATKSGIFLKGGFMLGLCYNAADHFEKEEGKEKLLTYKLETTDQYNRIDAGLLFGMGYKFKGRDGLRLGVQYYYGLLAINKAGPDRFNNSFYITAGIPVGRATLPVTLPAEENK